LARIWPNRPPLTEVTLTTTNAFAIPDDGLRLLLFANSNEIEELASFRTAPGSGLFPDVPTLRAPLVDVGEATNVPAINLAGQGALIARSANVTFAEKIFNAAAAGAEFAVIYNLPTNANPATCPGGDQLCPMGATDFVPIPAVFIGHNDGITLRDLFATDPEAEAQIRLNAASHLFSVTNTLLLEHVGVRLQTDHPCRGDLRITLVAPSGVRSVLQRFNGDTEAGPVDWTYWSTHHFYESSAGEWRLEVSDQLLTGIGSVVLASLILRGTAITDSDADGLDDTWEQTHFGSLTRGPRDDPDDDGYRNAREQVMGTDPNGVNEPFRIDLARWNAQLLRLNWPGVGGRTYEVWGGEDPGSLSLITNVDGSFPETEWFVAPTNGTARFFQVRTASP
jgi:subtilisin-like proprotein convertase family protein